MSSTLKAKKIKAHSYLFKLYGRPYTKYINGDRSGQGKFPKGIAQLADMITNADQYSIQFFLDLAKDSERLGSDGLVKIISDDRNNAFNEGGGYDEMPQTLEVRRRDPTGGEESGEEQIQAAVNEALEEQERAHQAAIKEMRQAMQEQRQQIERLQGLLRQRAGVWFQAEQEKSERLESENERLKSEMGKLKTKVDAAKLCGNLRATNVELKEQVKDLSDMINDYEKNKQRKARWAREASKIIKECQEFKLNVREATPKLTSQYNKLESKLKKAQEALRKCKENSSSDGDELNKTFRQGLEKQIATLQTQVELLTTKLAGKDDENKRLKTEIADLGKVLQKCGEDARAKAAAIKKDAAAEAKAAEAAAEAKAEPPSSDDMSAMMTPPAPKVEAATCSKTVPVGFVPVGEKFTPTVLFDFAKRVKMSKDRILVMNLAGDNSYCPILSWDSEDKAIVLNDGNELKLGESYGAFAFGLGATKFENKHIIVKGWDWQKVEKKENMINMAGVMISRYRKIKYLDSVSPTGAYLYYLDKNGKQQTIRFANDEIFQRAATEAERKEHERRSALVPAKPAAPKPKSKPAAPKPKSKPAAPPAKVDYKQMTVKKLSAELKKRKLNVSGLKSELVKRLEDDDKGVSAGSGSKPASTSSTQVDDEYDGDAGRASVFKDGDAVTAANVKQVKDLKISVKKGDKIYEKIVGTGKRKRKPTVKVVDKDGKESEINRAGVKIHIPQNRFEAFEGIDGLVPALPSIRIPERHEMM